MAIKGLEKLKLLRQKQIIQARKSLWIFCQATGPDFYKDDRSHLKTICDTLQALYEGRIIKETPADEWHIVDNIPSNNNIPANLNQGYQVCKRLMMNCPPQHGKSRTLINFADWVFGKHIPEKIITCSYNDSTASDFSRYVRDGIMAEKNNELDICYSDIFPLTRIKEGNAGFEKWALNTQHFSYLGAGIGGSITGKGGSILIVDDPIKGAEEAYNDGLLDKIWRWYTGTFLSRVSAVGGEPVEIVNMTRWCKNDICGKILDGPEASEWYTLKFEAYNQLTNEMLCPELLSKKRYLSQQTNMDDAIFMANYHQEPIDVKGCLYKELKEYTNFPRDIDGNINFDEIISYTDTADEGKDWLCSIVAGIFNKEAWILDVYYSTKPMEITEKEVTQFFINNLVGSYSMKAKIESNNGGRGFARTIERLLWDTYKSRKVEVEWFHQSLNKQARILTNASYVINHVFFPQGWNYKYLEFYKAITSYQKEGKNKHDDAVDTLTGICEMIEGASGWIEYLTEAKNKRIESKRSIPISRG